MSSKKALKSIFDGDDEELAIARRIISTCIDYLKGKVTGAVTSSLKSKVF